MSCNLFIIVLRQIITLQLQSDVQSFSDVSQDLFSELFSMMSNLMMIQKKRCSEN